MELDKAKMCNECNGLGGGNEDYMNSDHHLERGTGDWVNCENCLGTGVEPDDEIVMERIVENTTKEQEDKLHEYFMRNDDVGAMCNKDNIEEYFEKWLGRLSLKELISILYGKQV